MENITKQLSPDKLIDLLQDKCYVCEEYVDYADRAGGMTITGEKVVTHKNCKIEFDKDLYMETVEDQEQKWGEERLTE